MRYLTKVLLNSVAMASTQTSAIVDMQEVAQASLQFTVASASSPTGTVAISFSNDGVNFGSDPSVTAPTVTANGTKIVNFPNPGAAFMQVVYTTGTGTGNLTLVYCGKGV